MNIIVKSFSVYAFCTLSTIAQTTNQPPMNNIHVLPSSVQEMLAVGPPQLKFHSLAMISQNKTPGSIDESYLPGLKVCAGDPSPAIRSITARLIGQHFINDIDQPSTKALELINVLTTDSNPDVRHQAIFHGLTNVKHKSPELTYKLLEYAACNREQTLYEKIIDSLSTEQELAEGYLKKKFEKDDGIKYYELYYDLTNTTPSTAKKYMNEPSSLPQLFVCTIPNPNEDSLGLINSKFLTLGIENFDMEISRYSSRNVALVTTYKTKDSHTVKMNMQTVLSELNITEWFWLTPKLKAEIDAVKTK